MVEEEPLVFPEETVVEVVPDFGVEVTVLAVVVRPVLAAGAPWGTVAAVDVNAPVVDGVPDARVVLVVSPAFVIGVVVAGGVVVVAGVVVTPGAVVVLAGAGAEVVVVEVVVVEVVVVEVVVVEVVVVDVEVVVDDVVVVAGVASAFSSVTTVLSADWICDDN